MEVSKTLKDWLGTFWRILISPTPETFEKESGKANNKFASVIGWTVFLAIYSYLIPALAGYFFDFTIIVVALLAFPLTLVLASSAASFVLQRVFHRKQYLYDKILYIFTAIIVVFQLIITPVTFFAPPAVSSVFNYIVVAYQFVLLIIAVKGIARLEYWKSIVTIFATVLAGATILICTIPFVMSIIGGVNRTMR